MIKVLKEKKTILKFVYANDFTVNVILTNDIPLSRSKCKILGDYIPRGERSPGALFAACDNDAYIFLPLRYDIEYVTHESFHCVWHLMDYIGAEHENEIMAYHLSYLVQGISDFYVKLRKRGGKASAKALAKASDSLSNALQPA